MELGLSLGDHGTSTSTPAAASKLPFGLLSEQEQDQSRKNNKKITSTSSELGFCMALGIGGHSINHQKSIEINEAATADDDNTSSSSSEEESDEQIRSGDSVDTETPPLQLDLLPLAPVIPSNNTPRTRSLRCSSDNGSSENGSSGNGGLAAARGFDVNRLPAGGDEVSSPNNSMASSFQMDFTIFRGGSTGSNAAALARSGNKRDSTAAVAGGNDAVAGERGSDDDENGLNSSRKKLRLSKEQSAYLEESFKEHNTLNPKQKLALAKQLNLRPRQVEVWFQNRRARTKLKQTEVDCEYLKRCCETLTEENRRLHKELAELRALKTSNPFYMQLPPTTLTMCPSCERTTVATTTTSTPPPTIAIPSSTSPAVAVAVAVTPATTTSATDDSIPKAIPYPPALPRPRLMYGRPFSHNHNHPPNHSAPS